MSDATPSSGNRLRTAAAVAVAVSAALLATALALPTVTFETIVSEKETYSIYGGIESFWEDGNYVLASIVFLFSIVFPIGKMLALSGILLRRGTQAGRHATVFWLEILGKWSMLDVFIIAVFVGAIRLGVAEATSRPGIYVFATSILLSMIGTLLVARWVAGGATPEVRSDKTWVGRILTLASAAALVFACSHTILQVERKLLFMPIVHAIDLPRTAWKLAHEGERFLAAATLWFVLGASALRALLLIRLRWLPGGAARTRRFALRLDEWTMLDVYALAVVMTHIKLAELTTTRLHPGFWWVIAAAVLAEADAWWFRRSALRT